MLDMKLSAAPIREPRTASKRLFANHAVSVDTQRLDERQHRTATNDTNTQA